MKSEFYFPFRSLVKCGGLILLGILLQLNVTRAQQPAFQIPVQLPTIRFFEINTVVSVPDGGIMSLGGISRSSSGRSSAGIPLLSNIPGLGRPFRHSAYGGDASASGASVRVQIISNREISEQLRADADRRELSRQSIDPNGSAEVQRRADFISRNVGRR